MTKIMLVVALGGVLGWVGLRQVHQVQVDGAVASVTQTMAQTTITLPNLDTPLPAIEMLTANR